MRYTKLLSTLSGLWILTSGSACLAQPAQVIESRRPAIRAVDVRKSAIENPVKSLLAPAPTSKASLGYSHYLPLRSTTTSPKLTTSSPESAPLTGLVSWHNNFAEALDASRKSGKPVFLFQMLGRLDDRFC